MTLRLAAVALAALLSGPSAAQILVYGELSRDRTAEPGTTYEEVVEVHNTSDLTQQVRMYQTDYQFAADGSNLYPEAGSLERSNAAWISFAPPTLTVPPGETLPVTLTIEVPPAVAAPGTYWSMLMVEPIPRGSAESTLDPVDEDRIQFGVLERVRYGVQIATHVGAADAAAEILEVSLGDGAEGPRMFTADVSNAGERMLDGRVYLDLFGQDGSALGRLEGSAARIYPGTSFRHRVDLSSVEPGVYEALLVIDGGEAGVFGAQYTLEL